MANQIFPGTVLVANRGEIARRVITTCRRLGIRTVAVYHRVDADLPFVAEADVAVELTSEVPVKAYLDANQIINAAIDTGAEAVHPGYGFLSENTDFARAVVSAGMLWIGPTPESIAAMGDKIEALAAVAKAGVPIGGSGANALGSVDEALAVAEEIGYPVMVKAAGGGGGIGMAVAENDVDLAKAFEGTRSMAERSFGSGRVFVERYIASARHVEIQVLGCADGTIHTLGQRDCSSQRRHQKLIEEAPAPGLSDATRAAMAQAAVAAASQVSYLGAGTIEFLLDTVSGDFIFLEMNTRIQVEHPVTELTQGVDIVEQQLAIAKTGTTTPDFAPALQGWAIEARVCAEDPKRFFPRPGPIGEWVEPSGPGIRVDAGYAAHTEVTPHFDSLVAKVIAHGQSRDEAIDRLVAALEAFVIGDLVTNVPFLIDLASSPQFRSGAYDTTIVSEVQADIKDRLKLGERT